MSICVDASVVIKWFVPEEGSDQAMELYERWNKKRVQLIAPTIIDYEVGSTIRQKLIRGEIGTNRLFSIYDFYRRLGLLLFHLPDLVQQGVTAAASIDQPNVYDVAYLLIAKQQRADLVTADEKFCRKAEVLYPFVKFYKEYSN